MRTHLFLGILLSTVPTSDAHAIGELWDAFVSKFSTHSPSFDRYQESCKIIPSEETNFLHTPRLIESSNLDGTENDNDNISLEKNIDSSSSAKRRKSASFRNWKQKEIEAYLDRKLKGASLAGDPPFSKMKMLITNEWESIQTDQRYIYLLLSSDPSPLRTELTKAISKECTLKNPLGMINMALCVESGGIFGETTGTSFALLSQAAEMGNPLGQRLLADRLMEGKGCVQNQLESLALYRRAADLESAEAINILGYFNTKTNPKLAFEHFKTGAAKGNEVALYNMAICYLTGVGSNKDIKLAMENLIRSAELGSNRSHIQLAKIYECGEQEIKQDYVLALDHHIRSQTSFDTKPFFGIDTKNIRIMEIDLTDQKPPLHTSSKSTSSKIENWIKTSLVYEKMLERDWTVLLPGIILTPKYLQHLAVKHMDHVITFVRQWEDGPRTLTSFGQESIQETRNLYDHYNLFYNDEEIGADDLCRQHHEYLDTLISHGSWGRLTRFIKHLSN